MNGDRSPYPQRRRGPIPPEPSQVIRRPTSARVGAILPTQRQPRPPAAPTPRPRRAGRTTRPVASKKGHQRRKAGPGRILALSLAIAALLVATGIVGEALWLETSLHREAILSDYPDRPAAGRGTNWLLVGSDSRQGLTAEQQHDFATGGDIRSSRTDTILLVHLPGPVSGTPPILISIPRDSYVVIPGHGKDKINAAFAMGGAPLLAQTIEQATGLRLGHYAEVGFSGFAGLVDAVGGVTMCPTEPISDPLAGIDLPAGCQQLNGRTALGYVRTRATPRADLDRMINQRQFMSALLHRAASTAVWLNPWRWYSVPHAAIAAVTFDQGDHAWDVARLGWALHESTMAMTVPISQFTTNDAGSVVVWNDEAARELFETLGSDAPVPASTVDDQP